MEYLKERWQEMDWGRRIVLLIQPVMLALFLTVFLTFSQRQTVSCWGGYLDYERQGETAVYSGRAQGHSIRYVVPSSQEVEYWLDGALYSRYTITEDPSAIPPEAEENFGPKHFTGVEIRRGDRVWVRSAYSSDGLLNEDGSSFTPIDGSSRTVIVIASSSDQSYVPKPSPGNILYFALGPEISTRGDLGLFLLGLLISAVSAVSLLFEEQLFLWSLSFTVRDTCGAEPTEWVLFGRWVGWIVMTGIALVYYAGAVGLVTVF